VSLPEVDVTLTRQGDRWLIDVDGTRLLGSYREESIHSAVDCWLMARAVRDGLDSGLI
jgi:hypothetical protein